MRASAWASPPGLKPIPTRSRRTAQVLRIVRPSPLLRDAASASARGPRWAPAAPPAVETWSGCVEATRRPQPRHRLRCVTRRITCGRTGGASMSVCSRISSVSGASAPPQCGQRVSGASILRSTVSSGGRMRQAPTCPPFRPGRFGDGERLLSGRAKGAAPREARRSSSSKRRSISASRASSSAIRSACRSTKSARVAPSRASRSARFIPAGNHAGPARAS